MTIVSKQPLQQGFSLAKLYISVTCILYTQLYYMRLDVSVMCGKALNAIGIHRLLTNPH